MTVAEAAQLQSGDRLMMDESHRAQLPRRKSYAGVFIRRETGRVIWIQRDRIRCGPETWNIYWWEREP